MHQQLIQQQLDVDKVVKDTGLPAFEADVELLVDNFCWQVRHGAAPSLSTFKQLWKASSFSLIYQAVPSVLQPADFLQLLYSAALNRLDCAEGPFLKELLQQQIQQQQQHQGPILLLPALPAHCITTAQESAAGAPNLPHVLDCMLTRSPAPQQQQQQQQQQEGAQAHEELLEAELQNSLGQMLVDAPAMELDLAPVLQGLTHEQAVDCTHLTTTLAAELPHASAQQPALTGPVASCQEQQQQQQPGPGAPKWQLQASMGMSQPPTPHASAPLTGSSDGCLPSHGQHLCVSQFVGATAGSTGPASPYLDPAAYSAELQQQHQQQQQQQGRLMPQGDELNVITASVGALYCVYCLYQAQLTQPRVHIYLPLELAQHLEQQLLPAWFQLGLATPVRCLQVLWQDHAFMIGALRKPRHGTYVPVRALGTAASRAAGMGVAANPLIMQSRPIRDALLHLRSSLKALTDFKKLSALSHDYAGARARVFQRTHERSKQQQRTVQPSQDPVESDMFEQPPFIYDESWPQHFKAKVDGADEAVQDALRPLPAGTSKPTKARQKARGKHAVQAAASSGAADKAAAAEDENTRLMMVSGVFGDILRRKLAKSKPTKEVDGAAASGSKQQLPAAIRTAAQQPDAAAGSPPAVTAKQKKSKQSHAAALLNARLSRELREAGLLVAQDAELDNEDAEALSHAVRGSAAEVVRRDAERRTAHMCVASTWLSAHDALMQEDAASDEDMPDLFTGTHNSRDTTPLATEGSAGTSKGRPGSVPPATQGDAHQDLPAVQDNEPGIRATSIGPDAAQAQQPGKGQQQQQQQDVEMVEADAELERALSEWVEEEQEPSDCRDTAIPEDLQHAARRAQQPAGGQQAASTRDAKLQGELELDIQQDAAAAAQELAQDRAAAAAAAARAMPSSRASSAAWLRRARSASVAPPDGPDALRHAQPANLGKRVSFTEDSCQAAIAESKDVPRAVQLQPAGQASSGRASQSKRQHEARPDAEQTVATADAGEVAVQAAAKRPKTGRAAQRSVRTSTEQGSKEVSSIGEAASEAITSCAVGIAVPGPGKPGKCRKPSTGKQAKETSKQQPKAGVQLRSARHATPASSAGAIQEGGSETTSVGNAPQHGVGNKAVTSMHRLPVIPEEQTVQPTPYTACASMVNASAASAGHDDEDDDEELLMKEALAASMLVTQLHNRMLTSGAAVAHASETATGARPDNSKVSQASIKAVASPTRSREQRAASCTTASASPAASQRSPRPSRRSNKESIKQSNGANISQQRNRQQQAPAGSVDMQVFEAAHKCDVLGMGLAVAAELHLDQEAADDINGSHAHSLRGMEEDLEGLSSDDDVKQAVNSNASAGLAAASQAEARKQRAASSKASSSQQQAHQRAVRSAAAATGQGRAHLASDERVKPSTNAGVGDVDMKDDDDDDALLASVLDVHQKNSQQLAQLQH